MTKTVLAWVVTILMTMISSSNVFAQQTENESERFVGKWDHHAGIVSFFIKDAGGKKQARLLAVDEDAETKLSFDLLMPDVEDLEELVEITLIGMGNPDALPIPPLGTREVVKNVGNLAYPTGNIKFTIVDPAGTKRYVTLLVAAIDKRYQCVYWMDKEDLVSLKKLLDHVINEMSKS
jgi:hypothetical protein